MAVDVDKLNVNVAADVTAALVGLEALKAGVRLVEGAVGAVVSNAKEWVELSNKQEDAEKKLAASLRSTNQFTEGVANRFKDYAASLQETTKVADEDLLPLMGQLLTTGNLQADQVERTTKLTLDFARANGLELKTAFLAMSKAATGNVAALGRYGITVEKSGDTTKDLNNVLDMMAERFGGFAEDEAQTFSGALEDMGNTVGDTKEVLGDVVKEGLKPVVEVLGRAAKRVQEFIVAHKTEAIVAVTKALSFLADAALLAVKAGGALVEVYAELRAWFARFLNDSLRPVIDALGWLAGFVSDDLAAAFEDLRAGLEANVEDQERFAGATGAAVEALENQAQTIRDEIVGGLEEAARAATAASESEREYADDIELEVLSQEKANRERERAASKLDEVAKATDRVRVAWQEATPAGRLMAEVAAKGAREAAAATSAFADEVLRLQEISVSADLSTGERVAVDPGAIEGILETLRGAAGPGIAGQYAESAIGLVQAGDVGGLRNLLGAVAGQADLIARFPGASNGDAAGALRGMETLLGQMLGQLIAQGDTLGNIAHETRRGANASERGSTGFGGLRDTLNLLNEGLSRAEFGGA